MSTHAAGLTAGAFALIACASCSSGGSSRDSTNEPTEHRVVFADDQAATALPNGVVHFTIDPAIDAQTRVTCVLDGAAVTPCMIDASSGEIRYEALEPGAHQVVVELTVGPQVHRSNFVVELIQPDIVVFGATPGGITAAIAAAAAGQRVALLEPTRWVGGMMSGGLSKSDVGRRGAEIIGGLTAQFFDRARAAEARNGACVSRCDGSYEFEPHVAEALFEQMLSEAHVIVEREAPLVSVTKEGTGLRALSTSRGEITAKVFMDASYEGDLIALSGISYAIGREPRLVAATPVELSLQEDHAGVQRYRLPRNSLIIDPYRSPGDAASGTLSFIDPRPERFAAEGSGDSRIMAYTYRLCVTNDPGNRIAFARPENYDPQHYEAHERLADAMVGAGLDLSRFIFNPAPIARSRNGYKYDLNGGSTFSIDMTAPDMNQAYLYADETLRSQIRQAYRDYIEGLLYTWQTSAHFSTVNQKVATFGYCADEFRDRGAWPHQLYVRTGRRMIGAYVMNENDVLQNGRRVPIEDVVGFGAYDIDMHTHQYMAAPVDWPDGTRRNALTIEGFQIINLPDDQPYPVAYRALVPLESEVSNVLAPVPLSATYVAYSSLRMEPTFMILGESAGVAAALAVERQISVQQVPYADLRARLQQRGQKLTY